MSAGMAGIAGIAAVQARITELRTLVAPETVAASVVGSTTTSASTSGLAAGGTSSASSFASALSLHGLMAPPLVRKLMIQIASPMSMR